VPVNFGCNTSAVVIPAIYKPDVLVLKVVHQTVCVPYVMCVCLHVSVDAELDEGSVDDVARTEDVIVSEWEAVSADEKHQMRQRVDEILGPLGFETSLLVIRRANSLALLFLCMTLSALTRLRGQWVSRQLRDILESLFTLLSGNSRKVRVKRLTWPLADYEQCLQFFSPLQGNILLPSFFQ